MRDEIIWNDNDDPQHEESKWAMPPFIDLTGKRFGLLTVIKDRRGQGINPNVVCRCACGKRHTVRKVFVWSGRWEDGTGYFVDIRQCENGYKLFRSGNDPSGLKFVGMTERRFLYRESDPSYIHILKYESKDRIQDVWIDIEKNEVWNVGLLHRKKDSSEDIVSVVSEVGRGGKGGLFHCRKTWNRRKNHPKIILGRRNK